MKDKEDKMITEWERPRHRMEETQYGSLTYQEWCGREVSRINASGSDNAKIITDAKGLIAVSR